jgi:hypothetical protein
MKTFWSLGLWALFAFSALSGVEPARGGIGENQRSISTATPVTLPPGRL